MKKLFLYLPVILFLISLSMSVYTAEVRQVTGMANLDNFRLEWRGTEGKQACQSIEKQLAEQQGRGFIIQSLSKGQGRPMLAAQISLDGAVLYGGGVIRDRHGKIRPQMNESTRQDFEESLNEEAKEGADRLRAGESITLRLSELSRIMVTYDPKIKLISKEGDKYPVSLSQLAGSKFISIATSKRWRKEGDGNIKLEITGERLKTFCSFLGLEGVHERKKLVEGLSVSDFVSLMRYLVSFQFPEEEYLPIFVAKTFSLLREGNFEWLEKISSLSSKKLQLITEKILKRVIPPVPRVLFKIAKVSGMVFSPDSKKVAIRGDNGGQIRDLETGKMYCIERDVKKMYISPDFRGLAISRRDNGEEIRDLEIGKIGYIKEHVRNMVFSQDSKKVAINKGDNGVEIRDLETGKIYRIEGKVKKMYISPDFRRLAISRKDNGGEIINLETGEIDCIIEGFIWEMSFSPDSKRLVINRRDNGGEIINPKTGEIECIIKGHIWEMSFSPDSRRLTIRKGIYGGEIIDFEAGTIECIEGSIWGMYFSPDSRRLAISKGVEGGEIRNLETGEIDYIKGNVKKMYFSPDSRRLTISKGVNKREIINLETGEIDCIIEGSILKMYFSPNSRKLALVSISMGGEIRDLETGKIDCIGELVREMSFSPDSRRLAIRKGDNEGEIMDLKDYNRGIEFTELKPDQLRFVFNLVHTPNYLAQVDQDEATQTWRSINPEIRKMLKREYFPPKSIFLH